MTFRGPTLADGPALHRLVKRCPPLDENSRYCNLLQVSHFADTAIVAEIAGELVGFITGYRIPGREDVLFVWQVAVGPEARGAGVGQRMLLELVRRVDGVRLMETTVTPDNEASSAMFQRFAEKLSAPLARSPFLSSAEHFEGEHDDEILFRIGPLDADLLRQAQ